MMTSSSTGIVPLARSNGLFSDTTGLTSWQSNPRLRVTCSAASSHVVLMVGIHSYADGVSEDVSLYDELGGIDSLRRLSDAFYRRVLEDEVLAPVFAGFEQRHVEHVAIWLGEVFGGPP